MRLLIFAKNFRGGIFFKIIEQNSGAEFRLLGNTQKNNIRKDS